MSASEERNTYCVGNTRGTTVNSAINNIEPTILDDLVDTIKSGRCVAFVGAGFSADSQGPTWMAMVDELITRLENDGHITTTRASTARDYVAHGEYDAAASVAIDKLDIAEADSHVRAIVKQIVTPTETTQRDEWLTGIPFAAVLTTNYDGRPGGTDRGHDAYRRVLRRTGDTDAWLAIGLGNQDAPAVALHGQLEPANGPPLVLTRRQYRDLLYRDPGYRTFLRSLFATTTVLFLGKSFGDEYLNEMRSEILSLVGDGRVDEPLAYAAVPATDFTRIQEGYLRDSEGIQLLRYGSPEPGNRHAGFDALLETLYDRTNFFRIMQSELSGLRVLWLDTNAESHWGAVDVDATIRRIEAGSPDLRIERTAVLDDAVELARSEEVDFIISNWGHQTGTDPVAIRLLDALHDHRRRTPLLVFAGPGFESTNRAAAVRAGAYAFEVHHEGLFRRMHELASSLNAAGAS